MALQLRALAAPPENWGLTPCTDTAVHICNFSPRESDARFGTLWTLDTNVGAQIYMQANIHIHKIIAFTFKGNSMSKVALPQ